MHKNDAERRQFATFAPKLPICEPLEHNNSAMANCILSFRTVCACTGMPAWGSAEDGDGCTELSDYSVCTTWGLKGKKLYLLNVKRKRLEFSMRQTLDGGAWVIVNLEKGRLGELALTLGSLILSVVKNAFFTIFCDEFQKLVAYDQVLR